jgi:hypothetical protein
MTANEARLVLKYSKLSLRYPAKRNIGHVASRPAETFQKPYYVTSPIFYVNSGL